MNYETRKEILKLFNTNISHSTTPIVIDGVLYGYTYKLREEYGVAIPYSGNPIEEKFNRIFLKSTDIIINGEYMSSLNLCTTVSVLMEEFSMICSDFVEMGVDNQLRNELLSNPTVWYEKWKSLLGNSATNPMVYDVIGEMKALVYLMEKGENPHWCSTEKGTHDIETDVMSYEVKSTIKKSELYMTVSSPFQLETVKDKKLKIMYLKLEKSEHGESVQDLYLQLIALGYNQIELDDYLLTKNFGEGKSERRECKYKTLDMLLFDVDLNFPKMTINSFKDNQLPYGVLTYSYTIDLANLQFVNIYHNED